MAQDSIPSLVLRFSLTTFAALFFSALYNLVDTLFVSRGVGDDAMGGVSVVLPFMLIQSAVAQTVGGGAASVVSRCLGKKENAKAGEATLNAMAVFYLSAVVVTVLGFVFMEPVLSLLGATEEILPYARAYYVIILAGSVFSTGFSSIIRAEGRMRYALLIWLVPTGVNILLDAVFIFGLHMGVRGAALATVLCQCTSFLMSLFFFTKLSCQRFRGARLRWKTIKEIIGIGIPTLVQMGSLSVLMIVLNNILRTVGGTAGVNTFAYLGKLITFGIVPFNAVAQALAPLVGFNHGAGNPVRVRKLIRFAAALCTGYALAALVLAHSLATPLLHIFTDDTALLAAGARGLRRIALALPFVPVPLLAGTCLQAVGQKAPAFLLHLATLACMLPCAFLFAEKWGVDGVWWAFAPACAAAAALTVPVVWGWRKKENKQQM